MNANEFIKWFETELQNLGQDHIDMNRFEASNDLVSRAINRLINFPSLERKRVLDAIIVSHQSGMIGNYKIPVDDRDKFDTIEAILASIEGYLE